MQRFYLWEYKITPKGEELDDKIVVQKVLISLPMRYDPKISTLEDRENLEKLTMDELHGIITTYEMKT
jgi:hypothetical protein